VFEHKALQYNGHETIKVKDAWLGTRWTVVRYDTGTLSNGAKRTKERRCVVFSGSPVWTIDTALVGLSVATRQPNMAR
jgi:hypothetical protein